jgi:hypothetical protein
MFKLISSIKLLVIVAGVALLPLIFTSNVQAVSILNHSCVNSDTSASVCQDGNTSAGAPNPIFGPNGFLTTAIQIIAYIVGIASIIMIIISALRMVLSGGEPSTVSSARSAVLYSLIGVAIAVAAQAIVVFVLKRV